MSRPCVEQGQRHIGRVFENLRPVDVVCATAPRPAVEAGPDGRRAKFLHRLFQRLLRAVGGVAVVFRKVSEIRDRNAPPSQPAEDGGDELARLPVPLGVAVAGDDFALSAGGVDEGGGADHPVALRSRLLAVLVHGVAAQRHDFDADVRGDVHRRHDGAVVEADGPVRVRDGEFPHPLVVELDLDVASAPGVVAVDAAERQEGDAVRLGQDERKARAGPEILAAPPYVAAYRLRAFVPH